MNRVVPRLKHGDRVRLPSYSSAPDAENLRAGVRVLESRGLKVPGVVPSSQSRGGTGAYRIAHAIDLAAAQLI